MNTAKNRERAAHQAAGLIQEQKNATGKRAIERLPGDVQNHILEFVDNRVDTKKINAIWSTYQTKDHRELKTNLFSNYYVLCEERSKLIAHNLLWQINVEKTLALTAQYPESLLNIVEIKDPHGQRVRGTPLQIVYAAGDRNTKEMVVESNQYGLVERLLPYFKDQNDYYNQLRAWDRDSKQATEKTMASYKVAMETLFHEIIASEDISHVPFEESLLSPIAEKFRKSLTPNPNYVVTSGFLFGMQIFLDFLALMETILKYDRLNIRHVILKDWNCRKSDLFAAIVYPALQARCQRCDLAIFKKGIGEVYVRDREISYLPDRLDFSKGTPSDLQGVGTSHFFGVYGAIIKLSPEVNFVMWHCKRGDALQKMCEAKISAIAIEKPLQNQPPNRCVML